MKHLTILREYLDQRMPGSTRPEIDCTCGALNHAAVHFFRVHGQPVAAICPETRPLTAEDLERAVGHGPVEPLASRESAAIFADTELGHMHWYENPFGFGVYVDRALAACPEIVFCPRMYFGRRGECLRVPTSRFLNVTHAVVLALTSVAPDEANAWAV